MFAWCFCGISKKFGNSQKRQDQRDVLPCLTNPLIRKSEEAHKRHTEKEREIQTQTKVQWIDGFRCHQSAAAAVSQQYTL